MKKRESVLIIILLFVPILTAHYASEMEYVNQPSRVLGDENQPAEDNWLDGWAYRKSHNITGVSGAGTNYQVRIVVNHGAGTDSGNTVYCNSHCQGDFGDIRFTDDDGITQLDYWIEEKIDDTSGTFWVEVRDDLSFNQSIYVYYGTSTQSSTTSNGTDTFIFFDDYEDQDLSEWDTISGACTINSEYTVHGSYSLKLYDSPGPYIYTNITQQGTAVDYGFMIHNWVRDDNQLRGGHAPVVASLQEGSKWPMRGYESSFQYFDGVDYTSWPQNSSGASDTWFQIELGVSYDTGKFYAWKNGLFMGQLNLIANNGNPIPSDIFRFGYSQQSGYGTWYDDTFIRKWMLYGPSSNQWGIEQPAQWLNDWSYRKSHTILGSPKAGNNYQIQVRAHYGAGIDSGADVFLNEKCQADFGDIRFTDDDGITQLDYWMEEYTDSSNATFWVEVGDNLDFDQTIYIYYGTFESTVTNSNGDDTFLFFDDFNDGSFDSEKWTWYNLGGTYSETGGVLHSSTSLGDLNQLCSNASYGWRGNVAFRSRFKADEQDNTEIGFDERHDGVVTGEYLDNARGQHRESSKFYHVGEDDGNTGSTASRTSDWTSYSIFEIRWFGNGTDGSTEFYDGHRLDATISVSPFEECGVYFYVYDTGNNLYIDWINVRSCIETEPIHSSWGKEEISSNGQRLPGWNYRKTHTIEGSSGAGSNYQMKFIAKYGTGIDSGDTFYLDSHCNGDFTDLRFTDDDGSTLLDYWIESYSPYDQATVWVEIADSLDSSQEIHVYYGNPQANSLSNGTATFIRWDDFDLGYSDGDAPMSDRGWTVYNQEAGDVCAIVANLTNSSGNGLRYYSAGGTSPVQWLGMNWTKTPGVAVNFDFYYASRERQFRIDIGDYEDDAPLIATWANPGNSWHYMYHHPDWPPPLDYDPEIILDESVWYDFEYQCMNTSYILNVNGTAHAGGMRATGDGYQNLLIYGYPDYYDEFYFDNFFIRKYIENEPQHSSWSGDSDGKVPVIEPHPDVSYEAGEAGNWIVWNASDTDPSEYEVYRDGELIEQGEWDGSKIYISVDGLTPDTYSFLVVFYDTNANSANDEVIVTVSDTIAPIVDAPADIVYEAGSTDNWLNWTPSDVLPDTFIVYRNDSIIKSGVWTGSQILVSINGLDPAVYNYTLLVSDTSNNTGQDTVFVTVEDTTVPVLSHPADITYELGTSGNEISWSLEDLYPGEYSVFMDGTEVSTSDWLNDSVSFEIDGFDLGEYIITLLAVDEYGNNNTDSVTVTVEDTTAPTLSEPIDIQINSGATGVSLSWVASDLRPDYYEIVRNGTLVETGSWDEGAITFVIPSNLSSGVHEFTLIVYDTSGNHDSDTVLVTVIVPEGNAPSLFDVLSFSITIGSLGIIIVISVLFCKNRDGTKYSISP